MHIPRSTYRLQFNPDFGFAAAQAIVPYLKKLGISDLYASPIFRARNKSTHGYDVVDPKQINPELGSEQEFEALLGSVKEQKMSWLQDIVPNHMAFDRQNLMLMDIFENGSVSRYFNHFDVDWNHFYEGIRGRIVAPFLGKFFGEALEEGEIVLQYDQNGFSINYYDLKYPLLVETYLELLNYELTDLHNRLESVDEGFKKLVEIIAAIQGLSRKDDANDRFLKVFQIKNSIWDLYSKDTRIKDFIDKNIRVFNGVKGNEQSFNLLENLLSKQLYRLAFWKFGTEEINYRRFFNINELISVRVEHKDVLDETHSLIYRMIDEGKMQGLRVDHVDGLYHPTEYLRRLRNRLKDIYLVVEKILELKESLPGSWPVEGTSGYEFTNYVNEIFCQPKSMLQMTGIYRRFVEVPISYSGLVLEKKRLILGKHMAGDIDNLAHLLKRVSSRFRYSGDITIYGIRRALVEVMAFFNIYRTYINPESYTDEEKDIIRGAVERARLSSPGLLYEFNFIEHFLLLKYPDFLPEEDRSQWLNFVMRFQQFTGPLMAKGFEDTLLYDYNRLISLNEVGGNPAQFGISPDEFHRFNQQRREKYPNTLNTTSTHDTKRSEDVRARINVLSELPVEWQSRIRHWSFLNRNKKKMIKDFLAPSKNDEYFLYQTLLGAFPFDEKDNHSEYLERMKAYTIKAVREAKVHTAWLKPDLDYEQVYIEFLEKILTPSDDNVFLNDFIPFQKKISAFGVYNSLSQTLIKLTSPGVPDFYQGTELWDFSLVDPDNRRPVDFKLRETLLDEMIKIPDELRPEYLKKILPEPQDGRVKLFLTWKTLQLRNQKAELFEKGEYIPLLVEGKFKDNLIAFARRLDQEVLIVLAPRFLTEVVSNLQIPTGPVWEDTLVRLPADFPAIKNDALSGVAMEIKEQINISEAFRLFPGALLVNGG